MNVKQKYDQDTHATAPDTPDSLEDECVDNSEDFLMINFIVIGYRIADS